MLALHPAVLADIPTLRELARRIWWAHYPGIISNGQIEYMLGLMYSSDALERQMAQEGVGFWLIRKAAGTPVGFAAVSQPGPGDYFLQKFYLEQIEQGKGLGTEAFHALLNCYPGAREFRLTVNRQNYKSINFYFKVGFRIEKCIDVPIGHGFVMNDFQMLWTR
ncbi:MAG: GNAT family N-acetyltransferase [Saprospirales bacterium]|jgi:RimJ/RimL family protein N-acetyltransferase|nr:GNAT family N-acetyltransferase [Saprospirales bacterium]MBK8922513.1 GNAT family N-acetyltransferase [Saprospirales bacterium]